MFFNTKYTYFFMFLNTKYTWKSEWNKLPTDERAHIRARQGSGTSFRSAEPHYLN